MKMSHSHLGYEITSLKAGSTSRLLDSSSLGDASPLCYMNAEIVVGNLSRDGPW